MAVSETAPSEAAPPTRRKRRPSPRIDQWKRTWYFLRRNTLALVGLGIIVFFIILAVYAVTTSIPWTQLTGYCATNGAVNGCVPGVPSVCTYPQGSPSPGPGCYQTPALYPSLIAPTIDLHTLSLGPLPMGSMSVNPSGTLFFNTYQGLLRGIDWSLMISISIVAGGAMAGLALGALSGFLGGTADEVIMRIVDIFLSIPQILFVIIVIAVVTDTTHSLFGLPYTSTKILLLILGFMAVWWPFYARIVRGQVLVTREQKYVEAARASGAGRFRIVARHIIPNSVYPVFIQMSLDVGTIPLLTGFLVFLGFLIFPTQYFPEWGAMAANAISSAAVNVFLLGCQTGVCVIPWWQFLFPGLAIFLFAISVNFVADGLRDALDPRLRR